MQSPSRDQEVHSDRVMGGPQPRLSVVQPGDPPGSPPAHVSSSPPLPTVGYVTTALGSLLNDPRPLVSPIVATHLQTVVCYNPPCSSTMAPTYPKCHCNHCHLAMSNNCPNPYDAATVRGFVRDWASEAAAIKLQLEALQSRFQVLETSCQLYSPILAPIRRLPLEILGEIFSCVGSQTCLISICRVCKIWRDAAYLTPRLWQHTVVDLDRWSPSQTYESVATWMSRSKTLPRNLTLNSPRCSGATFAIAPGRRSYYCSCEVGTGGCRFQTAIVKKLLMTGPSLGHVSIRSASPRCLRQMAAYISASHERRPSRWPWSSLRSITISASEWVVGDVWVPSTTFSFLPDSIRILQLDLPQHARTPYKLRMELPAELLGRLTSLALTCDWTGDWIFKTLRHCANLEVLKLYLQNGDFNYWERDDDPYMVEISQVGVGLTLPNLHTLLIDELPVPGLADLQILRLPSLRDVSITFGLQIRAACTELWGPTIPQEYRDSLAALVGGNCGPQESGVHLLRIANVELEGDTLGKVLRGLPALKHLTLEHVLEGMGSDLFERLSRSADLVPRLKTLALLRLHEDPNRMVGLAEFVKERKVEFTSTRCM